MNVPKKTEKVAVIWIDREHAKLFYFSETGFQKKEKFHASRKDHHTHARDGYDLQREENFLFREAAQALENVEKILIVGPGISKHHFRNYLREQSPMVFRKVLAVENCDHPTDAQIAALARTFYARITA